ncbi:MAG: cytidylate kinase [Bdellovibrionales bacterium RIFOXYD1_FULL_53_11]|nr:MAG: cytidylate kinase [Bdellovibrionales bacterium RIFOXYD1_FULL_53_11]
MAAIPKLGPVIAIDGPAGTGKSSATRRLADALGFVHVDTGALYRALAWTILQKHGGGYDEETAGELARTIHLEFRRIDGAEPPNRVFADGADVTAHIRTPDVSMAASRVSAFPDVRAALLGLQRRLGCAGRSVLEGRDIGTVVFPDADVKFFLTASVEERVRRRHLELVAAGGGAVPPASELRRQIEERDRGDSTRKIAPLQRAPDALEIDTSAMTLDEVVAEMERLARERLGGGA